MRPCDHANLPQPAPGCRVCELYFTRPDYRGIWDAPADRAIAPPPPCTCADRAALCPRHGPRPCAGCPD